MTTPLPAFVFWICGGSAYLVLVCTLAADPAWRRPVFLLSVTAALLAALIANTVLLRKAASRLAGSSAKGESH